MKSICLIALLWLANATIAWGQYNDRDSLKRLLNKSGQDTTRVLLLSQIGWTYRFSKTDSCVWWTRQALTLARELKFSIGEVKALNTIGESLRAMGNYPEAIEMEFQGLQKSIDIDYPEGRAVSLVSIGVVYVEISEYDQSLRYFKQANMIFESLGLKIMNSFALSYMGNAYEKMNMLDSALFFQQQAYAISQDVPALSLKSLVLTRLGTVYSRQADFPQALRYYKEALRTTYISGDLANRSSSQYRIAELFRASGQQDSSLYFARLAFRNGQGTAQKIALDASSLMSTIFKDRNLLDSAFHYQQIAMAAKDSLFGPEKFHRLQMLIISEQERQHGILEDQVSYRNTIKLYSLLGATGAVLLIAILLYRSNRQKQNANMLLQKQKDEVQSTMAELKATQSQLIQSEKMASLGELTAGIAHEIQNPLNFVNNFSELNKELLVELTGELDKGNLNGAKGIASGVIENEEKINSHGKRADSIVKGMLQHTRTSAGIKELISVNALAEEYSRLAYHGLRAKDKSFNATIKTDFDPGIGQIHIIPQDIGRVILNLITNAFYEVNEKKKQSIEVFEPTIQICTRKINGKIEIQVEDNGNGIPQKIMDKIFQPFFTTKPAGQGTGLGLSLSYDIVKMHGGELKVETNIAEGKNKGQGGTRFTIVLPED